MTAARPSQAGAKVAALAPGAADVFTHLGVPVAVVDGEGRVHQANAAAEDFFGASSAALAVRGLPAAFLPLLARAEGVVAHDLALSSGERTVRADVTLTPIGAWPGWRALVIASRKTDTAADPLAAAGIAAQLAHEIKNPLGGIRGAAQLLGQDAGPEARELIDLIQGEVDRVTRLVERLERLADHRPPARDPVNLHEVLQHVRLLARGFAPGVAVREAYDPSLPQIGGDREALIQLFLNLVKNAAEAIGEQGEITLATSFRHGHRIDGRPLPIEARVEDDGPGVTPAIAARLFTPFATTKASGGGLGLALVAKVAADHGGAVSYKRAGDSSVFKVAFAPFDA